MNYPDQRLDESGKMSSILDEAEHIFKKVKLKPKGPASDQGQGQGHAQGQIQGHPAQDQSQSMLMGRDGRSMARSLCCVLTC